MQREVPKSGQSTPRAHNNGAIHSHAAHAPPGTVKEMQWLMQAYGINPKRPLTELRHCTSSLFVILSQRMFATTLENIYESPTTYEMKLHNIKVVLSALESVLGRTLDHVFAHEIVMLNERHIGRLIREFYDLAMHIQENQLVPSQQQQSAVAAAHNQAPTAAVAPPLSHIPGYAHEAEIGADHHHHHHHPVHDAEIDDISEVQDEPSQADSAEATHQFVEEWKERVVPPNNDEAQLASIRQGNRGLAEMLQAFDRRHPQKGSSNAAAGAPFKPTRFVGHVPEARPKRRRYDPMVGEFRMMKVLPIKARGGWGEFPVHQRNVSADDLRAAIHAERIMEEADREIASALAAQESLAEATMADFGRQVAKQRRMDLAELRHFIRDEDELHRDAFLKVVASRKHNMMTKAQLAKDELYYDTTNIAAIRRAPRNRNVDVSFGMEGHVSDSHPTSIILAAKRALAQYAIANRREMQDEYNHYRSSLTRWREVAL